MRSVLVPLPPISWGGLPAFAANVNRGLRDVGWKWVVAVPNEATEVRERLGDAGVDVVGLAMSRIRKSPTATLKMLTQAPSEMRALAALGRERGVSLVQAVGAHHYHGPIAARLLGLPLVWQIHSDILPNPLRPIARCVIDARADALMTNGVAVSRAFWGDRPLGARHFVFYAPVDTGSYVANATLRAEVRAELGIGPETFVVGTVGNRVWQKNHDLLVEVAEHLAERGADVVFLVLGAEVPTYAEAYQTRVLERARQLDRFKPGLVRFINPGRAVARYLPVLDTFILTSHSEGVPVALAEAMSAELPAVSTDVGSIREVIAEGETGFIVPPGDRDGLVRHLETLLHDPDARTAMGTAARARILSHFSLQSVVATHLAAYEFALKKSPPVG